MLVLLKDTDGGGSCQRCAMQAECGQYRSTGEAPHYIPEGAVESCLKLPNTQDWYYAHMPDEEALYNPCHDFDGAAVATEEPPIKLAGTYARSRGES